MNLAIGSIVTFDIPTDNPQLPCAEQTSKKTSSSEKPETVSNKTITPINKNIIHKKEIIPASLTISSFSSRVRFFPPKLYEKTR